jgi:hypothetical protein
MDMPADVLYTQMAAAQVVPRAMQHSSSVACAVCAQLPSRAANNITFPDFYEAMSNTPDIKNIVLEAAVSALPGCENAPAAQLVDAMMSHLVAFQKGLRLLPHLERSLAFILGTVQGGEVTTFLLKELVLRSSPYGLRSSDRLALLERITRSSVAGFRVAAGKLQKYAEGQNTTAWTEADPVLQMVPFATNAHIEELPYWVPVGAISQDALWAMQTQKHSEFTGASIVCS